MAATIGVCTVRRRCRENKRAPEIPIRSKEFAMTSWTSLRLTFPTQMPTKTRLGFTCLRAEFKMIWSITGSSDMPTFILYCRFFLKNDDSPFSHSSHNRIGSALAFSGKYHVSFLGQINCFQTKAWDNRSAGLRRFVLWRKTCSTFLVRYFILSLWPI